MKRFLERACLLGFIGLLALPAAGQSTCRTQILAASDAAYGCEFGSSISMSDGWLVIGSRLGFGAAPSSGAAYVFRRQALGAWIEHQKLFPPDGQTGDSFGAHVTISGNHLTVTESGDDDLAVDAGAVHVYRFDALQDSWVVEAKLVQPPGQPVGRGFGSPAVMKNGMLVVGSTTNTLTCIVHVLERDQAGQWQATAALSTPFVNNDDRFGWSIDLDQNWLVVGAFGCLDPVGTQGAACVYRRTRSGAWLLHSVLRNQPGDGAFGASVAVSGDTLAVGTGTALPSSGWSLNVRFFRFDRAADSWVGDGYVQSSQHISFVLSGRWLALDGTRLIRGDMWPWGNGFGRVRMLARDADAGWHELAEHFPVFTTSYYDNGQYGFGYRVAIDGDTAVCADRFGSAVVQRSGLVYVYELEGTDCNGNTVCDAADIGAGTSADVNRNGIPDECEAVPGDISGDGHVNVTDLLALISGWGPCTPPPTICLADVAPHPNGDGQVNVSDLLLVISNWGS